MVTKQVCDMKTQIKDAQIIAHFQILFSKIIIRIEYKVDEFIKFLISFQN